MAETRPYYLTTPIYYVNDVPHVGHAYTTIAADAVTRARRIRGREAFLLTGTDEHGQNIERIARERGVTPQEHCDAIAARFRSLWERYDIRYDRFIRTTDDLHKRGVLALWERLKTAKTPGGATAVYRGKYAGWYCPRCEAFKNEDELKQPGNLCPDHELPCEWTEEENFFFRLSAYSAWLEDEIGSGRLRIDPAGRRNEVLAVIRQGLQDFSISRARVKWGIAVPGEPGHVFYVWMDALANYVTALGFADGDPAYERYWTGAAERFHLVGKEIIRFHCLYWPAMLHAAGMATPSRRLRPRPPDEERQEAQQDHGQRHRSRGAGGPVRLRRGAVLPAPRGQLRPGLGLHRPGLRGPLQRRPRERPREPGLPHPHHGGEVLRGQGAARATRLWDDDPQGERVFELYEALDFAGALGEIWSLVSELNQAIVVFAPWVVAKDQARRAELDRFLYRQLERDPPRSPSFSRP